MTVETLGIAGGLFFLLTFNHFVVDWLFQTHKEAMEKPVNNLVRARHCLIYTVGFLPLLLLLGLNFFELYLSLIILFLSHFVIDTYVPVYLWVKYVRKPPEMSMPAHKISHNNQWIDYPANDKDRFVEFTKTPLGKIITITVDQIIHILFLIPLMWMALN